MEELKGFLLKAREDHRIGAMHISLYLAIVLLAPCQGGVFLVSRKELFGESGLLRKTAYYKCLKELAELGYIEYWPEKSGEGSVVRIVTDTVIRQLR